MAAATLSFDALLRQLRSPGAQTVFFIHGEEGYYTDRLVQEAMTIVPEEAKSFDEDVVYAPQYTPSDVVALCRQLPFMAPRRVVIVKEAQSVRVTWLEQLAGYMRNPNPQCLLVIAYRGAQAKGVKLTAALKAPGVTVWEGKRVNDSGAGVLIGQYLKAKGLLPQPDAVNMLRDHLGTDLSRLYNEIDKLAGILPQGATVTADDVVKHVGVSREFNSFQLVDALAEKDPYKVMRIAQYFAANPKQAPTVMVIATLYAFYSDLCICLFATDRSDASLMGKLGLKSPWALRRYRTAMSYYNAWQAMEIIHQLRQLDCQVKGVGSRQDEHGLLRQFLFRALTTDGRQP